MTPKTSNKKNYLDFNNVLYKKLVVLFILTLIFVIHILNVEVFSNVLWRPLETPLMLLTFFWFIFITYLCSTCSWKIWIIPLLCSMGFILQIVAAFLAMNQPSSLDPISTLRLGYYIWYLGLPLNLFYTGWLLIHTKKQLKGITSSQNSRKT